jgi:hypothetical protein
MDISPFFKFQCPHCSKTTSQYLQYFHIPQRKDGYEKYVQLLCACCECNKASIFDVERKSDMAFGKRVITSDFFNSYRGNLEEFIFVKAVFPEIKTPFNHPAIPDDIGKCFVDTQNLFYQGFFTQTVINCRMTLELIVVHIDGKTLCEQIDKMNIPIPMKELAHLIRLFGNVAVHVKDTISKEDADEVIEFTKLLVEYLYILPHRVNLLKSNLHK